MFNFKSVIILLLIINSNIHAESLNSTQKYNQSHKNKSRIINKRDNCANAAKSQILASAVEVLKAGTNPRDMVSFFSSLPGLQTSIFGFTSDSTCDIHKLLSQVLDKIYEISKDILEILYEIKGQDIKRLYTDLSSKILRLLKLFKEHAKSAYKMDVKKQIKKQCDDINSGINRIYHDFLFIMSKDKAVEFLKYQAQYKQNEINKWKQQILAMTFDIGLIIKGCEEALGQRSNINLESFILVTENNVEYFNEHIIWNIPNDVLRSSIFHIANEGMNSADTVKKLKSTYSNFDWTVIFYSDKIIGFENHCAYTYRHSHCGSFHFIRELKNRNALIAWTVPADNVPDSHRYLKQLSFNSYHSDAAYLADQLASFVKKDYSLNFALAIRSDNNNI
jgi:hypothetical protein